MVAYTRANVAALNRLARARADQGRPAHRPDLIAPGGRPYAIGDPVVLLAPNHDGDLVTSQRAAVTAVDHDTQALTLLTDDGRYVTLSGEAIDADHLDHGYAMTVHREQGATSDRTHYLADGGGRELAYVAMSRARDRSTVHAVAADLDQAIDDVTYDWPIDRHQQWITDTHEPATERTSVDRLLDQTKRDLDDARRLLARLDQLEQAPAHEPPAPDVGLGL